MSSHCGAFSSLSLKAGILESLSLHAYIFIIFLPLLYSSVQTRPDQTVFLYFPTCLLNGPLLWAGWEGHGAWEEPVWNWAQGDDILGLWRFQALTLPQTLVAFTTTTSPISQSTTPVIFTCSDIPELWLFPFTSPYLPYIYYSATLYSRAWLHWHSLAS